MDKKSPKTKDSLTTQEWYDFIATVTDLAPGIHAGEKQATRRLLKLLAVGPGERVLDVGCGPGVTAAMIVEETGASVTGIDISPQMVSKARERAEKLGIADRADFQVKDVLSLDIPEHTFDVVLFESLLTILPGDPDLALAEMVRVLKPSGRIGGNEATMDVTALPELESLFDQHPAIQRTYTRESLRDQFAAAGLENIHLEEVKESQAPALDLKSALNEIGCGGLIAFFVVSYPKLVWKLITDPRFREAHRIDEQVTSLSKQYMGYGLITGLKPRI